MVSLVKRFSPPSCSLEIVGQVSPLSFYFSQPTFKDLYFQLQFEQNIIIRGDRQLLDSISKAVKDYVQNFLQQTKVSQSLTNIPRSQPYLSPEGNSNHLLHLGKLNQVEKNELILLTKVQLLDLAKALEEYNQEINNLTQLYSNLSKKRKLIITGVMGVVLTLGFLVNEKFFQKSSVTEDPVTNISTSEIVPTSGKKPTSEIVTPQPEKNQPITAAIVPPILEKRAPLSPPEAVSPPKNPQLTPSGETQSSESNVTLKKPITKPVLKIIPETSSDVKMDSDDIYLVKRNNQGSEIVINPNIEPKKIDSPAVITPNLSFNEQNSEIVINQNIEPKKIDSPININSNVSLNEEESKIAINQNFENKNLVSSSVIPNNSGMTVTPKTEEKYQFEDVVKPPLQETQSLFDYTDQVAEIRDYFQKNWQAPDDLKNTLQYRLIITKSGYLQSVIPVGYYAELYLNRVNFPPTSQPFVSPFSHTNSQTVRLVIQSDGNIMTFLE